MSDMLLEMATRLLANEWFPIAGACIPPWGSAAPMPLIGFVHFLFTAEFNATLFQFVLSL